MTENDLGAAMKDTIIYGLNEEIERMTLDKSFMERQEEMDYTDLRLFFLRKQYLEIAVKRRKMQLNFEKIKIEIAKLRELKMTTVNEASEGIRLVEEKMKEIGVLFNKNKTNHSHPELMNKDLKLLIEKLPLLELEIGRMRALIRRTKMRKMKIKYITDPGQVPQFEDELSSLSELDTYHYNYQMISSACANNLRAGEEREKRKANGLNYAKQTKFGIRSVKQYWHLKSQPQHTGVPPHTEGVCLSLKLPNNEWGSEEIDESSWRVDQWPLTLQIYSLKLRPYCSDDQEEDYSVDVFGEIILLNYEPGFYSIIHVKPQTLTKKDSYLLLDEPTFTSLPFPHCPIMIHVKLVLRGSDEPDKFFILSDELKFDDLEATRSMEVVDDVYMSGNEFSEGTSAVSKYVNLGTGKNYMMKLTHGIVVNTILANISVHLLHPSFLDSCDGKCKITAAEVGRPYSRFALVNSKKVPLRCDDKGCLRLLRPRICVDFFNALIFYIKGFGSSDILSFHPRDCYRHDNCEHKEALTGLIKLEVKWSTRETFPGIN